MTDKLEPEAMLNEIIAALGCAIMQSIPKDDQIIMGHVRDAHMMACQLRGLWPKAPQKVTWSDDDEIEEAEKICQRRSKKNPADCPGSIQQCDCIEDAREVLARLALALSATDKSGAA